MIRIPIVMALAGGLALLSPWSQPAAADIVQPVSIQLREQEPDTFLVQWQAPQTYPARALPEPVLPDDCRAQGERVLQERPGTWLSRQVFRCGDGLTGRRIGVRYPFAVGGQSSMMRLELLSGEQLVHVLNPGEDTWSVPEVDAGLTAELWSNLRRPVFDGVRHFFAGWWHWAFWLVLALLGGVGESIRRVTAFSTAQAAAVIAGSMVGVALPALLGEIGVGLAVVLLANEFLRPAAKRRQVTALAAAAGVVHGAGMVSGLSVPAAFADLEWLYRLLAILGMDATLLGLVLIAPGLWSRVGAGLKGRAAARILAYALGGAAVATVLALIALGPSVEATSTVGAARLPTLPGSEAATGMPGSRRVAATGVQAPVQSFLSIEAFEVRHQVLFRLAEVKAGSPFESMDRLPIELQPEVKSWLQEMALPLASISIDGEATRPIVDRIDFLSVDSQGVLPRSEPVPEPMDQAFVGITFVALTSRTPRGVDLSWEVFPQGISEIPATASDPEYSQTVILTPESPTQSWQNRLSIDLIPIVTAVEVEPRVLPIPLLALPFLAVSTLLAVATVRGRRSSVTAAWMRITLVVALVLAPLGELAVALPSSIGAVPSTGEARRILAGVLPNVYRAFEFREESAAYDRLAVSVTGEILSQVYLEHRRALQMEERGGARARVEAVEVQEVRTVKPVADGGFETEAVWVVGGTVTHFGHRHFRQNRYDARVGLVPLGNTWKISAIELFDEERLR